MRVLTLGETMGVIATPGIGSFRVGSPAVIGFAGSESTVAIGLARLGVDVTWVSRLGGDSFGAMIAASLTAEGIRVVAEVDAARPTGLMTKENRTPTHQRVTYRRAGSPASRLSPADVPTGALDVDHVHLTGITPALSPSAAETVQYVIGEAKRRGIPVSFDVNYRAGLWARAEASATLAPLLADVDVLFAGDDEAALFVDVSDDPAVTAARLGKLGPREVVLKRGTRGAVTLVDGAAYSAPARTVTVIDTVGAGDAFVAGYLAERLRGEDPAARLNTATITGAFACMSAGDWDGLPTRAELSLLDTEEQVLR